MTRLAVLLLLAYAPLQSAQLTNGVTTLNVHPGPESPVLVVLKTGTHAAWSNLAPEPFIDHAQVIGANRPLHWHLVKGTSSRATVQFVYDSVNPALRATWTWQLRASSGPFEHSIEIQNLSSTEVWLPLQDSFRFHFQIPANQAIQQFWVEKGASSPSAEGTHLVTLLPSYKWTGTSSTYAHPAKGEPREIIPYLLVQRPNESGWYMGIEFSGRTRISLRRDQDSLTGEAGLNPDPGPYWTRLMPGQTFETPTVFLGGFAGDIDDAGNDLRAWIRQVLNNPATIANPSYPTLVSNSWGSGMAINEDQAHHMIQDAAGLGLEMFHLDAGWFREIGDWTANPSKFPHGIASVSAYAHQLGLKFGLWTDWTQAGPEIVNDPARRDWLTTDPPAGWKAAEFKSITMDIGYPPVHQWAAALVEKMVSGFHLDMLEHDGYLVAQGCDRLNHPHAPITRATARQYRDEDFLWSDGANDTDVSYYATKAYYDIQSRTRKAFPNLLFEICNDGGRMVDFGSAAHGDYFSTSDAYDPIGNRRAFFDASHVLPPAMLESYVEKWPTPHIENFRYMLRSGMMGWFSLMQDSNSWTPQQHEQARAEFALYKAELRPLIRSAKLYHVSERPDGVQWDGLEYFDATKQEGVLYAFRATTAAQSQTFKLKGLRSGQMYRLRFHDQTSPDRNMTGQQLMQSGLLVQQALANSSELVFFEAAQ